MKFLEPPGTESSGFARPPEDVDQLLQAFFRAEMPSPWPEMKVPAEPPARITPRTRSLVRSRWALAASVALLAIGPWLVAGKFQTAPRTDVGPGIDAAQKNPSAAPAAPPKIRR